MQGEAIQSFEDGAIEKSHRMQSFPSLLLAVFRRLFRYVMCKLVRKECEHFFRCFLFFVAKEKTVLHFKVHFIVNKIATVSLWAQGLHIF